MDSALEQEKKRKTPQPKGFDARFADELAAGLRSGSSASEQFMRAVGESRAIVKKHGEQKKKTEDNEFAKKAREDHEKNVKIELKSILAGKKLAAPSSEPIFGKKKKKRDDEPEPDGEKLEDKEEAEREKLRELGKKWESKRTEPVD